MHTHLYFAVAALTASPALSPSQVRLAWQGEFHALERQLAARMDADVPAGPDTQRAYADMQWLFGRYEEAEQLHRDALKALADERDYFRVLSCRNAAWQALFLQRNGAALACFRRVVEDERAQPALQREAWLGLALVMFQLGQLEAAWDCAERVEAMAGEAAEGVWPALAAVLQQELLAQVRWRGAEGLVDHVFWRHLVTELRLPADLEPSLSSPVDGGALARHGAFQQHLRTLAEGGQHGLAALHDTVQWAAGLGMPEYARFLRLDLAVAALAGGAPDVARQALESFGEPGVSMPRGGHWLLDYLFCQAELPRRQGRRTEADAHYRRYCLLAMKRTREQAMTMNTLVPLPARREQVAAADDISARLVGKYRRAYAYLVEHLDQPDLSVKEVAAHIGVTERALQLAMRSSIGISPTQLIRRLRMERIHSELLSEGSSKNVLAIAAKWGVRHRSTLANAYRREFNESPTDTIMRSAA
ncbi:Transcriptional regulator, AraC family [plant metagenome]|uniref:Transcriptional regulator, AraC family n=1 Tax=plant metagenome TaxID=1297885 RepID=A0A484RUD9_9ZZZZ